MANEKKAVCGGFLIGDGLQMDGKVLSASGGGSEEPVEVTMEFRSLTALRNAHYYVHNYIEGKPIRFKSGYWGGYITCYPIQKLDYDGDYPEYIYYDGLDHCTLHISEGVSGAMTAQELWAVKVGYYDANTSKFEIDTISDSENYRVEVTGTNNAKYDYIEYKHTDTRTYKLYPCSVSTKQYSCLISNNDGTTLKRICLTINNATYTVSEKEISLV